MAQHTRREFICDAVVLASGGMMALEESARGQNSTAEIPKRPLGKTGLQTSIIGLGGYHLGSAEDEGTAKRIVDQAIDAGINFFDNAWDYHEGKSEQWLGGALKGKRDKVILMTKVCTHGRSKKPGMQMLEESLRRLQRRITSTSGRFTR
jgi:aryl-alcohol dehydrogenase-like predicted oxidoreductase